MSKERLKEIKERVLVDKVYYKYLDGTKGHWGKTYTLNEEDYNHLKEQAERVQELEELTHTQGKVILKQNDKLDIFDQQNKRYREAIELMSNAWAVQGTYEGLANYIGEIIEELEESK